MTTSKQFAATRNEVAAARALSPRRKTTHAETPEQIADEQLAHFGIDADSDYGHVLKETVLSLYRAQGDVMRLWQITSDTVEQLERRDRIAWFNAKKFLSFQIAKILDTLQNPFRKTYQSLQYGETSQYAKGPYPIFDNIPAIFSATPVVVRTATYIYACTEWVDDAFHGKEPLHQIYSRLMNPTSIALANAIVDLECGPYAGDYLAWNFNSGMAAIDGMLSNVLSHNDILIVSRNVYGGVHQLLHDYFARPDKFNIQLEWFDGYDTESFTRLLNEVKARHADRIGKGANVHVYIESPCNPHGYILDVPGISKAAHSAGNHLVMLDSTLATPFLFQPLQRADKAERPDYVMHSYTKDISGNGAATAGVIIGENYRMFIPKGDTCNGLSWNRSMFWDVYYIKGGFLDADKAWEVIAGMKTLEMRMLQKSINTMAFTRFLAAHPDFRVNSHAVEGNANYALRGELMRMGLPSSLFSIDMESAHIPRDAFTRFADALEPSFSQMVSIGQTNTMLLCPALTTHSELDGAALQKANIFLTTMRISMGDESVSELIAHFVQAAKLHLDPVRPGFSDQFMSFEKFDTLYREIYLDVHSKVLDNAPKLAQIK